MTPEEKARIKALVVGIRQNVTEMGETLAALSKSVDRLEAENRQLRRDAAQMRAILADVTKIRDGVGDMSIFDRAERWSKP